MSDFDLEKITEDIIKFEKELIQLMENIRKNKDDKNQRAKARQLGWTLRKACEMFRDLSGLENHSVNDRLIFAMRCEEELNLIR